MRPKSGRPGRVSPETMTEHGALLMQQFGAYYRRTYGPALAIGEGGCPPAGSIFVWADIDQRTRATRRCSPRGPGTGGNIPVHHGLPTRIGSSIRYRASASVDKAESMASVLGAVGGNLKRADRRVRRGIAAMESVLGCESAATCKQISQVPTTIANDGDGGLAGLSGGLDMAGDVAENMLLEYTNAQRGRRLGTSRIAFVLLQLLVLHVFGKQLEHGNRYSARALFLDT